MTKASSRYWYLDGFHLKVRLARRVVSAPVLAVLGVAEDGRKVLVSLRWAVSEAGVHWRAAIEDLKARGLTAPRVIVSDGHKGLAVITVTSSGSGFDIECSAEPGCG